MRLSPILAGTLALVLTGTGCATKKYVAQTMAPVEARVTDAEGKLTSQDQKLTQQQGELDTLETNLSRTGERLGDVDSKATAAGEAAQRAGQRADSAQQAADGARTLAQQSMTRTEEVEKNLTQRIEASNKFQLVASETILFNLNQYKLDDESKAKLDNIAARTKEHARFMVEVQGFTDKTGSAEGNEILSQRRAESVTRYLINEHEVPLRAITTIGSGYATPVADDSTRDGRKMNRRVEIRLFVPEGAGGSGQQVATRE
jgi:outer membrane protein OmpA-like peptidoglycan-associated protein